jgi:multidrug efflux pump subunit AcrA (membrane-fusion protein)
MSAGAKPETEPTTTTGLLPADEPAPTAPPDAGGGRSWLARRSRHPSFWVAVVALVAIVGFSVWWVAIRSDSGSSTTALSITTTKQLVTVTRGSMSNTVSGEGTIAAAQTDSLSFGSSGTVTAVNVQAGDTVTAGQVLATIDSAQLQASVSSAEATVASASAKLADDQASGASSAQLDADETTLTSANDALASAQDALNAASLVATFDGTVSQVNITVGEQLASGGTGGTSATGSGSGSGRSSASIGSGSTALGGGGSGAGGSGDASGSGSGGSSNPQIQVVSKGSYSVSLPVSSSDIGNVAAGQSVTLTLTSSSASAFPRGFGGGFDGGRGAAGGATGTTSQRPTGAGATATGTVAEVAKVATASSGVAQYPVTVDFSADSNDFYIGATVTGAIATNVREDVLQVPVRAVSVDNGASTVTVATKGTLSGPTATRTVKTGATANGMVEITDGLREGESVVVVVRQFSTTGNGSNPSGGTFPGGGNFSGRGRFPGGGGGNGSGVANGSTP